MISPNSLAIHFTILRSPRGADTASIDSLVISHDQIMSSHMILIPVKVISYERCLSSTYMLYQINTFLQPSSSPPFLHAKFKKNDYPGAMLFVRQSNIISHLRYVDHAADLFPKVIGDLWESYLRLLDDGVGDG